MLPEASVFIVDDDASVARGLSRLLRSVGYRVETFSSAREFLQRIDHLTWGCLVLDMQLPELTGLELQQILAESAQALSVVFITGHASVPLSVEAMKRGAVDFLEKPLEEQKLLQAIAGALTYSWNEHQEMVQHAATRERLELLTPREYQVLCGVVAGKLNKQIAADLQVGEKTIKVHRGRVMKKMGARSVAALVYAVGSICAPHPKSPVEVPSPSSSNRLPGVSRNDADAELPDLSSG